MKRLIALLAAMPLILTACTPTRIVTVSGSYGVHPTYTTVTYPRTRTVYTNQYSVSATDDISLHLDLQAVAAAFAQSSTVREFEILLNNSSYMISNLDLNQDGYVDYLRVIETVQGYAHVFVIQAILAVNVYQDVATIVAETHSYANYHVQVIGSPYIYGPNYIVEPVYYTRPVIVTHLCAHNYTPWCSPYLWGYYPVYYTRHAPVHIGHYHAYVGTYMRDHHYCHEVHYANKPHYPSYSQMAAPYYRNDYERDHPEKTFAKRTASIPAVSAAGSTANARTVREARAAATQTTTSAPSSTSGSRESTTSRTATTTSTPSRASSTTTSTPSRTSSTTTSTPSRTTSTTTSTPSRTSSTTTSTPSRSSSTSTSTTQSRVKKSGTATTTRSSSSTSSRSSSTSSSTKSAPSSSSSSRSSSSSSSSTSRSASSGSSTSRSSSSSSTRR